MRIFRNVQNLYKITVKAGIARVAIITPFVPLIISLQILMSTFTSEGSQDFVLEYWKNLDIVDRLTITGAFSFSVFQSLNPLLVTKDMTQISSEITLSDQLPFPKHGLKLLVSSLLSASGTFIAGLFLTLETIEFIGASKFRYISNIILNITNLILGKPSKGTIFL